MKHATVRLLLGLFALFAAARPAPAEGPRVLFSADTEGHAGPCTECPGHAGAGGLARRATAVARLRAAGPSILLDAGNSLYGPDSIAVNGGTIVAAYNELGYDAVNLTPRDFRLGKQALTEALGAARFSTVSVNLLDAGSGQPLVKPFVVKSAGGRRVAVVGVSEPPAGMDYLPHLRRQLAGVKIVPPAEALGQWLHKAKAEADVVVLLYYGPAGGAKRIAEAFGKDVAAVLVGGARPEELPQAGSTAVPLVATAQHGRAIARLTLGAGGEAEQVAIDDSIAPDPKMATLLAGGTKSGEPPSSAGAEPNAAADAREPKEGGVRKLVPVDVPPIEPVAAESAPSATPDSAPTESANVTATADEPEPAAPPDTSRRRGGTGTVGTGAWEFLKSLVGGSGGSKPAQASAETASPPPSEQAPSLDAPVEKRSNEVPRARPKAQLGPDAGTEAAAPRPANPPQRKPASTGPKFCTDCGAKLRPNAKFCTSCGTRVRR